MKTSTNQLQQKSTNDKRFLELGKVNHNTENTVMIFYDEYIKYNK